MDYWKYNRQLLHYFLLPLHQWASLYILWVGTNTKTCHFNFPLRLINLTLKMTCSEVVGMRSQKADRMHCIHLQVITLVSIVFRTPCLDSFYVQTGAFSDCSQFMVYDKMSREDYYPMETKGSPRSYSPHKNGRLSKSLSLLYLYLLTR